MWWVGTVPAALLRSELASSSVQRTSDTGAQRAADHCQQKEMLGALASSPWQCWECWQAAPRPLWTTARYRVPAVPSLQSPGRHLSSWNALDLLEANSTLVAVVFSQRSDLRRRKSRALASLGRASPGCRAPLVCKLLTTRLYRSRSIIVYCCPRTEHFGSSLVGFCTQTSSPAKASASNSDGSNARASKYGTIGRFGGNPSIGQN
jgi:hypothetical protein